MVAAAMVLEEGDTCELEMVVGVTTTTTTKADVNSLAKEVAIIASGTTEKKRVMMMNDE